MGVSSISRLKVEPKDPADLRRIAEALYAKLHVAGFQVKQKVAVITHMIGMVSESIDSDKSRK